MDSFYDGFEERQEEIESLKRIKRGPWYEPEPTDILTLLGESNKKCLSAIEIMVRLKMPRSSFYGFISELEKIGYVKIEKNDQGEEIIFLTNKGKTCL